MFTLSVHLISSLKRFELEHCSCNLTCQERNIEMSLTSLKFTETLFVIMWWVVSCLLLRFTAPVAVSVSGAKPMTFYNILSNTGLTVTCLFVDLKPVKNKVKCKISATM